MPGKIRVYEVYMYNMVENCTSGIVRVKGENKNFDFSNWMYIKVIIICYEYSSIKIVQNLVHPVGSA